SVYANVCEDHKGNFSAGRLHLLLGHGASFFYRNCHVSALQHFADMVQHSFAVHHAIVFHVDDLDLVARQLALHILEAVTDLGAKKDDVGVGVVGSVSNGMGRNFALVVVSFGGVLHLADQSAGAHTCGTEKNNFSHNKFPPKNLMIYD